MQISRGSPAWKSFAWLLGFSMLGITLHELAHHLFGVPSLMSLSRNYPLADERLADQVTAVTGTLAGPMANVYLGYGGLFLYWLSRGAARTAGLFVGIANLFILVSAAAINLLVDTLSGTPDNDLQLASSLLGWNLLILPVIAVVVGTPPLLHLFARWRQDGALRTGKALVVVFGAWLLAGLILMALDSTFQIRFTLR